VNECCKLFVSQPNQVLWHSVDQCVNEWEKMGAQNFQKGCKCLKQGKRDFDYFECYTGTEGKLLRQRTGGSTNTVFIAEISDQISGKSKHAKYGSCMHKDVCQVYEINAQFANGGRDIQSSCKQPKVGKIYPCRHMPKGGEAKCDTLCSDDKFVSDLFSDGYNTDWQTSAFIIGGILGAIVVMIVLWLFLRKKKR